jgi:hypothetical protein
MKRILIVTSMVVCGSLGFTGVAEANDPAAKLAREGRPGSIALRVDILMLVDGQPVPIKAPADQP